MNREAFERHLLESDPPIPLVPWQIDALWRHYELLARWNARINLTRVVELREAVRVHYLESLFVAGHVTTGVRRILDVGSGAGFPGFVVAVVRPDIQVTLLESDVRKAAFLREASDLVRNVRVVAKRSRQVEGAFDLVMSRAVRAEDVLEVALRVGRWVMLVGTEPPRRTAAWPWVSTELPGGRGRLWMADCSARNG